MENASKALIIAGEILIAILILGLLVYGYNNLSYFSKEQETEKQKEQLAEFNREYESYNKKLLRGVEVISLMNKVISANKKYENEEYYKISVEIQILENIEVNGKVLNAGTYNEQYYNSKIVNDEEIFTELKRRIFDCTDIKYNTNSGRINYMKFIERSIT